MKYNRVRYINDLNKWDVAIMSRWLIRKLTTEKRMFFISPYTYEKEGERYFPKWNKGTNHV